MEYSIRNLLSKIILSKEPQTSALKLSIVAAILFYGALTINHFRTPLLGMVHGYAPHNIAFNFLFFIPVTLIATIMAGFALGKIIKNWGAFSRNLGKYTCLLLTLPIPLLVILRLVLLISSD